MISGHRPFCKFFATFTVVFEVLRVEDFEIWRFQRWKVRNFGYLKIRKRDFLNIWKFENQEFIIQKLEISNIWKFRGLGHGKLEKPWKFELKIWKIRNIESSKLREFGHLIKVGHFKNSIVRNFESLTLWKFEISSTRKFQDSRIWRIHLEIRKTGDVKPGRNYVTEILRVPWPAEIRAGKSPREARAAARPTYVVDRQ